MSTTPRPVPDPADQSFSGSGPASLTERRRAETRMEIARAAAALFVRRGLRATRAEDIAQMAGIAPRTFYRYFATKEEAVAPLFAAGAQRWVEAVRTAPAHLTVPQALEHAVQQTLDPVFGVSAAGWEWVRTLIRAADASPALRRVWAEVGQVSEGALAEILARRQTCAGWAEAAGGGPGDDGAAAPPAGPTPVITPELRLSAAVAGSAVRVAVESWAATAAPATGPDGPAALALRNLKALRGFAWGGNPAVTTRR